MLTAGRFWWRCRTRSAAPVSTLIHRGSLSGVWVETAALVVEILSPDDAWEKLDFCADYDVDKAVIVDSDRKTVAWLRLQDGWYEPTSRSKVLGIEVKGRTSAIDWREQAITWAGSTWARRRSLVWDHEERARATHAQARDPVILGDRTDGDGESRETDPGDGDGTAVVGKPDRCGT